MRPGAGDEAAAEPDLLPVDGGLAEDETGAFSGL